MATKRKPVPKARAERRTTLTNVVCPRCAGAICYTPKRWLFCPRCHATKLGTAGAKTAPTGDISSVSIGAVDLWIAAGWELSAAMKRDSEACQLLRTAPPERIGELTLTRNRIRRDVERAAAVARWCRVAAFGESPL